MKLHLNLWTLTAALVCFGIGTVAAQDDDEFAESRSAVSASLRNGNGLEVLFPSEQFSFSMTGLAQPGLAVSKLDVDTTGQLGTFIRRSYLTFKAEDLERKIAYVVRANFVAASPLLDAYIDYLPGNRWQIRVGQFQNPTNNREMQFYEGHLAMPQRSFLSRTFVETGREWGLSASYLVGQEAGFSLRPTIAVTSGDGINSFGALSNDVDLGGLKVGGRLDVMPFGAFDATSASDFERNASIKAILGIATNYNMGASGPVGESHGAWFLYGADGTPQLPNYLKNSVDVLVKWKGASVMAEYVNAAAYNLQGSLTSASLGTLLLPTEISTYLVLGNAYNVQAGYLLENGWQIDARFGQTFPEFATTNEASILQVVDALGTCVTWHVNGQGLKLQAGLDYLNYPDAPAQNGWTSTVQAQILF
jgi:hypothetical protein